MIVFASLHIERSARHETDHQGANVSAGVELWLIRHGETEWSLSGAHTSRTDIPLTEHGCKSAEELREFLAGREFTAILTSPMQRARETCEIAGYGNQAQVEGNLREWDYGIYEGKTTKQIRDEEPGWSVWTNEVKGGETVEQVGQRADLVIQRALAETEGWSEIAMPAVALFAHAHILRILASRWIGLPAVDGRLFALGTGSISVLGWEREVQVVERWNRGFGP
jgi:broad specificity phosphatase PhoE